MLFTSHQFLVFFIILFALYWYFGKKNAKIQNLILLIASYVFYGIAEWKMIPLLALSTVVFYELGIHISKSDGNKQSMLSWVGITLGVGILLYFKYFNFFIQSFSDFFSLFGLTTNWHSFKILMPLGVSYFTFKLISYVLEVERGKMEPCNDLISFAVYVSFFPTIMAGPIDRPNKFIPQLSLKREFSFIQGLDGFQQIVWGLFKKVVIADNLSPFIDNAWNNLATTSGSTMLAVLILYSFQMYTDFSGYSDMAIGVGKLLGIRIAKNFNYPFFATSISEFWRRWHISLTGWLTDYVFIPLNIKFRDYATFGMIMAIIINMVLVGMWHGANWTYAIFGLYQGLLFIPVILSGQMNKKQKLVMNKFGGPKIVDIGKMVVIFMCYTIGTILFRADNIYQSVDVFSIILSPSIIGLPKGITMKLFIVIAFILLLLYLEWKNQKKEYPLSPDISMNLQRIVLVDYCLIFIMLLFGNFGANQFIYFQF